MQDILHRRIIIRHTSELSTYVCKQFPISPNEFRRECNDNYGGGEFHGPCPMCHAQRRPLRISNGGWYCRVCGFKGYLGSLTGEVLDEETARKQAEWDAQQMREKLAAENAKVNDFNRRRTWMSWHYHLMHLPDRIAELEQEGIILPVIKRFQIGIHVDYPYSFEDDRNQRIFKVGNAFTFPTWEETIMERDGKQFLTARVTNVEHRIIGESGNNRYRRVKGMPRYGLNFMVHHRLGKDGELLEDSDEIIIGEGAKKGYVLYAEGLSCVQLPGAENVDTEKLNDLIERFQRRFILLDDDQERIIRQSNYLAAIAKGIAIHIPGGGKPDDMLKSGQWTAETIIKAMNDLDKRTTPPMVSTGGFEL